MERLLRSFQATRGQYLFSICLPRCSTSSAIWIHQQYQISKHSPLSTTQARSNNLAILNHSSPGLIFLQTSSFVLVSVRWIRKVSIALWHFCIDAFKSIVAIYTFLSFCFCRAFNVSHPALVELSTKIILLSKSFKRKSSCFRRAKNYQYYAIVKNVAFVAKNANTRSTKARLSRVLNDFGQFMFEEVLVSL